MIKMCKAIIYGDSECEMFNDGWTPEDKRKALAHWTRWEQGHHFWLCCNGAMRHRPNVHDTIHSCRQSGITVAMPLSLIWIMMVGKGKGQQTAATWIQVLAGVPHAWLQGKTAEEALKSPDLRSPTSASEQGQQNELLSNGQEIAASSPTNATGGRANNYNQFFPPACGSWAQWLWSGMYQSTEDCYRGKDRDDEDLAPV